MEIICDYLDLIASFVKSIYELKKRQELNPFNTVFSNLWQFLDDIILTFNSYDEIIETTCRVIKHSIRCLNE